MLLETVEVSVELALAGLVVFALVYGAYRMMRRRVTWAGVLFTAVLLIILVGALPLPQTSALTGVRSWLLAVPGERGRTGYSARDCAGNGGHWRAGTDRTGSFLS